MLFSDLIVWYLFLGGFGGGLCLVALYVELRARSGSTEWSNLHRGTWKPSIIGSLIALLVGSVCLVKDLALPEKALLLFTKPTFSAITIGTYVLTCLIICLAIMLFLTLRNKATIKPLLANILRGVTALFACSVIAYTGVLLSSMAAVPLWMSSLVPVLFALSSLSSGIAGTAILAAFPQPIVFRTRAALISLARTDAVVIAFEIASIAALIFHVLNNPAALASIERLTSGHLASQFWIGFIACGLAAPLIMEFFLSTQISRKPTFFIVLGCFILLGAFFLRYCTVFGGVHLSAFLFA